MRRIINLLFVVVLISLEVTGQEREIPAYKNPRFAVDLRVKDILQRMTLDEKAGFLTGRDMWHFKGIERLDIPAMQVTDCGHGVTVIINKQGDATGSATCFPTAVGQ